VESIANNQPMIKNPVWYVVFGLVGVIILLILFSPSREPNKEKIESLEYAIAISDQQKKDLEVKHKADSTASAQEIARLNDLLSNKSKQADRFERNLAHLKANPVVIQIKDSVLEIKETFEVYDSLLASKDDQLTIQKAMIVELKSENERITGNFLERLKLSQDAFNAQKEISETYRKEIRKVRRGNRWLKVAGVSLGVAGLFLGSQL
jgi:predicted RNase H-like nuclease (RuvC/YqgF family)